MDQKKTEFLTLFRTVSELKNGEHSLWWATELADKATLTENWKAVVSTASHVTYTTLEHISALSAWLKLVLKDYYEKYPEQ